MNSKQATALYFGKASTWADDVREGVAQSKKRYQGWWPLTAGISG